MRTNPALPCRATICRPLRDLRVSRTGQNSGYRTVALCHGLGIPRVNRHRTVIPRQSPDRDGKIVARQKVAGTPKRFRNTARGCAAGATPGRRIYLKISPVRAAQTPGIAGFCATLAGLSPAGVPTRGRRETRQPRAVLRRSIRAFPNGNPQVWDFLPDHQK